MLALILAALVLRIYGIYRASRRWVWDGAAVPQPSYVARLLTFLDLR